MDRDEMVRAIEGEIARLEQVRELLLGSTSERFVPLDEGRSAGKQPRVLSVDARRRIAQAQKRRWAKARSEKATVPGENSTGA